MGSLDQHCSRPSFTGSVHIIWTPGINYMGLHPGHILCLSLCLVYSIDSPGSYTQVSLGFESFPLIARRDCTVFIPHLQRSMREISKGNVLGYYRNLGSLKYGNEYCVPGRAMSCTPLRCGGEAGTYIARGPTHFGGLHSHRLAQCHRRAIGSSL